MSGQRHELNTSHSTSTEELQAGKQLNAASQDEIKRIGLPAEQRAAGTKMSPLDRQKESRSVELSSILKCYERHRMHTLMLLMRHCSSVCSAVKRDNECARPTPDSMHKRR